MAPIDNITHCHTKNTLSVFLGFAPFQRVVFQSIFRMTVWNTIDDRYYNFVHYIHVET